MATSLLLSQVSSEFGGDALNRIASAIGESPGKIKTALSDMLPALLGGLASKAQTQEGAHELLDTIHREHLDTVQYEHVADAIKTPDALGNLISTGGPLLDAVLPGKSSAVTDWVASHAGIQPAASKSLMSMVLPLVMGLLGRRVGSSGESGLMSLLGKPQSFLQDAPGALAGVLGIGSAVRPGPVLTGVGPHPHVRHYPSTAGATPLRRWLLPILLLLALLVLIAYFMSRREPVSTTAPAIAPVVSGPELGPMINKTLPDGVTLRIPANGVESKLITFIENKGVPVSMSTWFSFDRLAFDTDAATLKPSSQEQVRNIAEIMKAYPQVKVKFGGYTDNTGNAQKNLQLSRERASSAMNQVVALGVDASRLSAEGYGEQNPVADNATPEGRQRNRRVDINVTAK